MLDIGFFEIAVVAVVALFVVGPERLPGLVRTMGYWFGKVRYWVNSTNAEMKREFHNAEILRQEAEQNTQQAVNETLNIQSQAAESPSAKADEEHPSKPL